MTLVPNDLISPLVIQSLEHLAHLQAAQATTPTQPPAEVLVQWKAGTDELYQALIAGTTTQGTVTPFHLMADHLKKSVMGQVSGDPQAALGSLVTVLAKHGLLPQPSEEAQAVKMRLVYITALYHLRRLSRTETSPMTALQAVEAMQDVFSFFQIQTKQRSYLEKIATFWKINPPSRGDILFFLPRLINEGLIPADFWTARPEDMLPFVARHICFHPEKPGSSYPLSDTQELTRPEEDITGLLIKAALKRGTVQRTTAARSDIEAMTTPNGFLIAVGPVVVANELGQREEVEGAPVTPYKITHVIGIGGAGKAYAGEEWQSQPGADPVFIRRVVIKIVPRTPLYNRMCGAEWKCQAGDINSFFVAALAQGVTCTNKQFLVLEELGGGGLRDNILRFLYYPPFKKSMRIILDTVAAMARKHREGWIHRDLNPNNIFLDKPMDNPDFLTKLGDFGGAILDSPGNEDRLRDLVGTPPYMSPEIIKGERATKRSDVFSLAMMAYELLTGKTAFADGDSADSNVRVTQALQNMRVAIQQGITFPEGSKVPPDLQRIILNGLEEDPMNRSAADAMEFLLQLLTYKAKKCEQRGKQIEAVREYIRVEEQLTVYGLSTQESRRMLAEKAYTVWSQTDDEDLREEMAGIVSDYEPASDQGRPLTEQVEEPVRFQINLDKPHPPNAVGSQITHRLYEQVNGIRTEVSKARFKPPPDMEYATPRGDATVTFLLYRRDENKLKVPVAREVACPLPSRPSSQHPTSPQDHWLLNFPVVTEADEIPKDCLIIPRGSVAFGQDRVTVEQPFAMANKITNAAYLRWLERLFFFQGKRKPDEIISKLPKHWDRGIADPLQKLWKSRTIATGRYLTDPLFSYLAPDQSGFFKTQNGVILHPEAAVTQFDYTDGLECLQGLYGEKARYPTPEEVLLAAIGPWSDRRFPWGKERLPEGGSILEAPPSNDSETPDYSPYSLEGQKIRWLVSGTATFCHLRPDPSDLSFLFEHLDPRDPSQIALASEWAKIASDLAGRPSNSLTAPLKKTRLKTLLGNRVPVMGYDFQEDPPDRIDVVRLADRTGKVGTNLVETGMFGVIPL